METWYRHQLIYKDVELGDIISMSPDKTDIKPHISPKLTILDFIKVFVVFHTLIYYFVDNNNNDDISNISIISSNSNNISLFMLAVGE
jgi:CDP-diglyceride synthetase